MLEIMISTERKQFSWSQTSYPHPSLISQLSPTNLTNLPLLMRKMLSFRSGEGSLPWAAPFRGSGSFAIPLLRPKRIYYPFSLRNMLQMCRSPLPTTVSHLLAEPTSIYSLGLFSQGIPCRAKDIYCQYVYA